LCVLMSSGICFSHSSPQTRTTTHYKLHYTIHHTNTRHTYTNTHTTTPRHHHTTTPPPHYHTNTPRHKHANTQTHHDTNTPTHQHTTSRAAAAAAAARTCACNHRPQRVCQRCHTQQAVLAHVEWIWTLRDRCVCAYCAHTSMNHNTHTHTLSLYHTHTRTLSLSHSYTRKGATALSRVGKQCCLRYSPLTVHYWSHHPSQVCVCVCVCA
jgi:hypothetical protein